MPKTLLFLAFIGLLTACASPAANSGTADSTLTNTRWKLTALSSLPKGLPALTRDVFLQLDTGRIKGHGGCNNYFGSYTTLGSTLRFPDVSRTEMYCEEAMEIENKLFEALDNTTHYRITGTKLELLKGQEVLATFEALYLQ